MILQSKWFSDYLIGQYKLADSRFTCVMGNASIHTYEKGTKKYNSEPKQLSIIKTLTNH